MRLLIAFALLAGIVLVTGNGLMSQDKKDPPKTKGTLPSGWKNLDLTAEQKVNIYKIQAKFKDDIEKLREKIKDLQAEERREMVKVLTDDQKKKLAEIATGEKKDSPPKTDSVKPKDGTTEKPKDKN